MTQAADAILVTMVTHRSFQYISDMLAFDALVLSGLLAKRGCVFQSDTGDTDKICTAAGIEITTTLDGYIEGVETGAFPASIEFKVIPIQPPNSANSSGLTRLALRTQCAIFSVFIDDCLDWVRRNVSTNYHQWPPVSNFCRVIRNAIVHGGTINIQSETAPTVRWKGLSFNHLDYGRKVFEQDDFSPGDMVILMIELDQELDQRL